MTNRRNLDDDDDHALARQNYHNVAAIFFIAVITLRNFLKIDCWEHFVAVTVLPCFPVISTLIIWRICLILSELPHFKEICSSSFKTLIKRNSINHASLAVILISTVYVSTSTREVSLNDTFLQIVQIYGLTPFSLSISAWILLFIVCRWEECATWEAHTMKCLDGLDYGSGMAHSFFYGYLKLTLPAKGDNNRSIRERIDAYIEKGKLTDRNFPVKKLITLIPRSGYSFPTFSDDPSQTASDKDIETAEALQDHLRDRAGTKGRVYRGGAYRIRIKSGSSVSYLYTIAEGATPVLTFREAFSGDSPQADRLRQHRMDVTSNFYHTLQNLIDQDPEVRDLAALIYYNDEDKNVNAVDVLKEYLLQNCESLP